MDRGVFGDVDWDQCCKREEFWDVRVLAGNDQGGDDRRVPDSRNDAPFRDFLSASGYGELHGAWRIFAKWVDGCRAGRGNGHFQFFGAGGRGRDGGRSGKSESGSAPRVATHSVLPFAVLFGRAG